ncbi:short-chain dehydrogenase/reductase [Pseudonocardia sp. CNS-139]|nr:short-chain dehydrogenase/reductase [Pseudonocardia sp. CNS-139]
MNTDSTSRVWFVTGASSGFGRALAEAALADGDTVVAAARRTAPLDDLVAAHPDRVRAVALDVTDTAAVGEAVAEAVLRHGRIDVLVNSAGRALVGAVEETGDGELRDLMDLHFFGPAALIRAVLPHMRRQGGGAVVNITSMGGRMSFAGVSAYSATKFALEGLSEALAPEVAPFGICVLVVEPGAFRTSLHSGASRQETAVIPAYDDVVGPVRKAQAAFDGTQPGDPAKAAAAILATLAAEAPPLRLVLGNDAVDMIGDRLARDAAELRAWEATARDVDIDA